MKGKDDPLENKSRSISQSPDMSDLILTILHEELTQIKNLVVKNEENELNWEQLALKNK